jgi:hypothetical protein
MKSVNLFIAVYVTVNALISTSFCDMGLKRKCKFDVDIFGLSVSIA